MPSSLLRICLLAFHPLLCYQVQHNISWTRFAFCGYLVSFVTKTNDFSVYSRPIQLSSPIYVLSTIKRPCFFMPGWLDWIQQKMLLYFQSNKELELSPQILPQTWCYSCSLWFRKGHGKVLFKNNFIKYCYFIFLATLWFPSVSF